MGINDYHFITRWKVKGTTKEVANILKDVESLVKWWPSVYLGVKVLREGNKHGVGTLVELDTKGWLPYTLKWNFCVTDVEYPKRIVLKASGDFEGKGTWTFEQDKDYVNIAYDWNIRPQKALLRYFTFLLKPIFSANHHWAMAKGLESLKLELERQRAFNEKEREKIPLPPQPTSTSSKPLLLGFMTLAGIIGGIFVIPQFFKQKTDGKE
jgi:hypothetical protein